MARWVLTLQWQKLGRCRGKGGLMAMEVQIDSEIEVL